MGFTLQSCQNSWLEAMAIEILSCPMHSMVIFHSYANHYQRVNPLDPLVNMAGWKMDQFVGDFLS